MVKQDSRSLLCLPLLLVLGPATAGAQPVSNAIQSLGAASPLVRSQFGRTIDMDVDTAVVGALGRIHVLQRSQSGVWEEVLWKTISDFGGAVGLSGDFIAVGKPRSDTAAHDGGSVVLYERDAGGADSWGQIAEVTASDAVEYGFFGTALALDGGTLVVGASLLNTPSGGEESGAAYVFERNALTGDWEEVATLKPSAATPFLHFGTSVAVDGATIVVGAPNDSTLGTVGPGSAFVFERDAGGLGPWRQSAELVTDDGANFDFVGFAVALDGDIALVGAYGDDYLSANRAGAAYVFERDARGTSQWSQLAKLIPIERHGIDDFGAAVAVTGSFAVVGAIGFEESGAPLLDDFGAAYVYGRNIGGSDNWGAVAQLRAADAARGDQLGFCVTADDTTVLAGAPYDDSLGFNTGAVYVFDIEGAPILIDSFESGNTSSWSAVVDP